MSWKRAVFFGGAVLVLAACSDATAPNSLTKLDAAEAYSKTKTTSSTTTTTTTSTTPTATSTDECTAMVIHTGLTVISCTTSTVTW